MFMVILGIGLGIVYSSVPEPPVQPLPTSTPAPISSPSALDSLESVIDREAQALAGGDPETFLSLQDQSDGRWFQAQSRAFHAWGRPFADYGSMTCLSRPLYTIFESGSLSSDRAWADVSQFRNGQYFRETRFYRQVNGQWLRTQPDLSFWLGKQQSFQTKHFEASDPTEDNTFIQMVAQRFEAAYDQVCADLDCTGDAAPIQLAISPSVEHSQWSAVDQHGTIVLPSPRISGMYDTVDDETARLLSLNRSHWGVENGLHYRRDETLREDWCHLKGGHAPRAMAVINNLIVGLVLHLKWTNLAEARRYYDAHPREAQHLVMQRLL